LCLEEELAKLPQDVNENSLTDRRVFYALEKLTDARVGRERSLQMALEVLPQGTLMDALPPMLVMDIVGRAEKDLVEAIQAEYIRHRNLFKFEVQELFISAAVEQVSSTAILFFEL
jgi:hypothetical protein